MFETFFWTLTVVNRFTIDTVNIELQSRFGGKLLGIDWFVPKTGLQLALKVLGENERTEN